MGTTSADLQIISDGEFARVQALRKKRRESHLHPARVNLTYVFKDIALRRLRLALLGQGVQQQRVLTTIALSHPWQSTDAPDCAYRSSLTASPNSRSMWGSGFANSCCRPRL